MTSSTCSGVAGRDDEEVTSVCVSAGSERGNEVVSCGRTSSVIGFEFESNFSCWISSSTVLDVDCGEIQGTRK